MSLFFTDLYGFLIKFKIFITIFDCCLLLGGAGGWSSEGCTVLNHTETETICGCNHLTSFGVLLVRETFASQCPTSKKNKKKQLCLVIFLRI